jgi:hypothetical protein
MIRGPRLEGWRFAAVLAFPDQPFASMEFKASAGHPERWSVFSKTSPGDPLVHRCSSLNGFTAPATALVALRRYQRLSIHIR